MISDNDNINYYQIAKTLEIAEKKSGGRCFGNKDKKYKDYIKLHHN